MQQVGRQEVDRGGEPLPIDPRWPPPPLRSRLNPSEAIRRTWVLHQTRVLRGLALGAVAVGALAIYQMREPLVDGITTAGIGVQDKVAAAGFGVAAIEISGQALTREQDVFQALGMDQGVSTFTFDAEAARQRIEMLPSVERATIRKAYPDHVRVAIVEKEPVARWRVDGFTFLINGAGEQIGEAGASFAQLPLVIGDGAADDALAIIRALDRHTGLKSGLIALSRIGDRRWDMIFDTGLRVQLPEEGVARALDNLDQYQAQYRLLDRGVTLIDLRVPGLVAVRPTELPGAKDKKKKS